MYVRPQVPNGRVTHPSRAFDEEDILSSGRVTLCRLHSAVKQRKPQIDGCCCKGTRLRVTVPFARSSSLLPIMRN